MRGVLWGSIILGMFSSIISIASETDGFTPRYWKIPGALQPLNREIERRLSMALRKANQTSGCNEEALHEALQDSLTRSFYGKLEGWINDSPKVPRVGIPLSESIYQYVPAWQMPLVYLGKLGFGAIIQIHGHLLGADKFGHFFDEGLHYFELFKNSSNSIAASLQYGIDTEHGYFGLANTGIKSYADMTANFSGMIFWSRILASALWGKGEAYFRCEKNQWLRHAPFDWSDYVDAGWDEGINCNSYRSAAFMTRVHQAIQQLEAHDGRPYACPVQPQECVHLAEKYGSLARFLLSKPCKIAAQLFDDITDEDNKEHFTP